MNCYYLITTEYEKEDTRYLLFRRNAELGLAIQEATKSVLKKAGIVYEEDFKIKKEESSAAGIRRIKAILD